jgi:hypothetical protein
MSDVASLKICFLNQIEFFNVLYCFNMLILKIIILIYFQIEIL